MDGSWLGLMIVFVGGVVGGGVRAVLDQVIVPSQHGGLPWGIVVCNVAGSLVLGVLVGVVPAGSTPALLIGTGGCGALTTFSAFSLHIVQLARASFQRAALYLLLSLGGGLSFALLGVLLGQAVGQLGQVGQVGP